MMKASLWILLLILFLRGQINGQIEFVSAYIINANNEKLDCQIKDLDWTYNPRSFEYRFNDSTEILIGEPLQIKEFGIKDKSKFVSYKLNVNSDSDPVFLKVLIEGAANLYAFENDKKLQFYYTKDNSQTDRLKTLNRSNYKSRLQKSVSCKKRQLSKVSSMQYTVASMKKHFLTYNKCANHAVVEYEINREKDFLNISLKPGLRSRGLGFRHASFERSVDFGNKLGYTFGIEAEVIAPIGNWNWSIVLEPTYQYYSGENDMIYLRTSTITRSTLVKVDYKSIEIPMGYRHLFFVGEKSRITAEAFYILDMPFGSNIEADRSEIINVDAGTSQSLSFGIGYNYKNRFSSTLRYYTNRQLLGENISWYSDYQSIALVLGYTIL